MKLLDYGLTPVSHRGDASAIRSAAVGVNRRSFIVTSLASGFALASNPILAQAINTDSKGLVAGEVSVTVADGKIPAYRAKPAKGGNFSVVLVIQEIFGVHEHIKDVCRRLAKLGYYAIAPELFSRQGDVSKMDDIGEILSKVVARVPDKQVFADIDATVAFAKTDKQANTTKLGIIGFCWGGRTVWLYAGHNPSVKAGVSYYGLLEGMKSDIKVQDPVDMGATLTVPGLGLYAGTDAFVKPAAIQQMRGELVKSRSGSAIVVFPGVDHGFNADYRPTYDKSAATYAWKLTRDWLKERGV